MQADLGTMPTPTEIQETTEVRVHLEMLAVALACQRRTEKDLECIEAVIQKTEMLLKEGGNIGQADTEFHLALVNATHNSVLVRVLNAFYRLTASRREVWFGNQEQALVSAREHHDMCDAIRNRDVDRAQALILEHMDRAKGYWSTVLGG